VRVRCAPAEQRVLFGKVTHNAYQGGHSSLLAGTCDPCRGRIAAPVLLRKPQGAGREERR
jgi:hypothetical protein